MENIRLKAIYTIFRLLVLKKISFTKELSKDAISDKLKSKIKKQLFKNRQLL